MVGAAGILLLGACGPQALPEVEEVWTEDATGNALAADYYDAGEGSRLVVFIPVVWPTETWDRNRWPTTLLESLQQEGVSALAVDPRGFVASGGTTPDQNEVKQQAYFNHNLIPWLEWASELGHGPLGLGTDGTDGHRGQVYLENTKAYSDYPHISAVSVGGSGTSDQAPVQPSNNPEIYQVFHWWDYEPYQGFGEHQEALMADPEPTWSFCPNTLNSPGDVLEGYESLAIYVEEGSSLAQHQADWEACLVTFFAEAWDP
ncbi:MAG: hypothetical protein VX899_13260 [Myxococcota bacterium]|nr:hypothetical protein [Myxococcota bacterium]